MNCPKCEWITTLDQVSMANIESLRRALITSDGAGKTIKEAVLDNIICKERESHNETRRKLKTPKIINDEMLSLIDGAYEIVELWKSDTPSQKAWKSNWLSKAKSFGAGPAW